VVGNGGWIIRETSYSSLSSSVGMGHFVRQLARSFGEPFARELVRCPQIDFVELALAATVSIPKTSLPPLFQTSRGCGDILTDEV